jgi:hypothetical protein
MENRQAIGTVNAERPSGDRPDDRPSGPQVKESAWTGSTTSLIAHWRDRAVRAEGELVSLRFESAQLREQVRNAVRDLEAERDALREQLRIARIAAGSALAAIHGRPA